MSSQEIVLVIEDTPVTSKRELLITNSDYFKAMLEGHFVERNKSTIKLEGVDLRAMQIIVTLLSDATHLIPNEDVLLVLETACMLQFEKIRDVCIGQIKEILSRRNPGRNCMKIWKLTEQLDIKPLSVKAKAIALNEFLDIKETSCILQLTLEEVYCYLGHIYLRTDNELSVFQTAMKWWSEYSSRFPEPSAVLLKLMSCIDYQYLLDDHLKEILAFPDIASNLNLTELLSCILLMKNEKPIEHFSENCQKTAKLLFNSKSRKSPQFPCILVSRLDLEAKNKMMRLSDGKSARFFFVDSSERPIDMENYSTDYLTVIYYDYNLRKFKKFVDLDSRKCQGLEGFKLNGYKEFIFMYGGEFLIGRNNWNYNFWVYNTISQQWDRKINLPHPRRHFETCMVGDKLYIVGGTAVFRVIQENLFCYNFKEDKWSALITLPCCGRQLKCCNYLNQLFILNINEMCGYFFNEDTNLWTGKQIILNSILNIRIEFAVFSYKNRIYLKGRDLVEFIVKDKEIVASIKRLPIIIFEKIEVVACNNLVYTFFKHRRDDNYTYSLQTYNLETDEVDFIFRDLSSNAVIDLDGEQYEVSSTLKLFSCQHYSLVEKNELVNDSFA